MQTIQDIRINVAARVEVGDDTIVPDILGGCEHDNLILALDRMTAPRNKGGLARKVYITSLCHDHHDDSALGPHSHHAGWACDLGEIDGVTVGDNATTRAFVIECLADNEKITKVGTIGALANDESLQAIAAAHNCVLFEDEGDGPHVHFQSA
jgi:hypothetical protein